MKEWGMAVLRAVEERVPPVFCVHYASESGRKGRSPTVVTIAVRVVGLDQTKVFSLDMLAEREDIDESKLAEHKLRLEQLLLEEFDCFVQRMLNKYPQSWWFHWAMRDTNFGWPHLEHRARLLISKTIGVSEESLVDLQAALASIYGREFIAKPQLIELAKLNGLLQEEVLSGLDELGAMARGDYASICRSTGKKAEAIGHLLVRFVQDRLKVDASPIRKRRRKWDKSMPTAVKRELVSTIEAARICGVSRSTWYRLRSGNRLPEPMQLRRRTLWDVKELRLWIDAQCPALREWQKERRLLGLGSETAARENSIMTDNHHDGP